MTQDRFKRLHSSLILQMQCIENDLRIIYAALKEGDFEQNIDDLEKANLGTIQKRLRAADDSDGKPDLSAEDYELIDQIRVKRNYWCHQCYLDYIYIPDYREREERFQQIAAQLDEDEKRTWQLHKKLEKIRLEKLEEYRVDL